MLAQVLAIKVTAHCHVNKWGGTGGNRMADARKEQVGVHLVYHPEFPTTVAKRLRYDTVTINSLLDSKCKQKSSVQLKLRLVGQQDSTVYQLFRATSVERIV
jgi:hypothetical protein